jgi:prevent-host-death family protein
MTSVSAEALRSDPDALLSRAERGEEIVIERDGRPIARIVPIHEDPRPPLGPGWRGNRGPGPVPGRRKVGWAEGRLWISDDFDDPLPEFEQLESDDED